jgi:replicative DNA helicase
VLAKPLKKERLLAEIRASLAERPTPPAPRFRPAAPATHEPPPRVVVEFDEALERVDASRVTAAMNDTATIDTLHELIDDQSPLGQRLISVANSAAYAGSRRVTSVARALVRLGTRKTTELIEKSSTARRGNVSPHRVAAVMQLLQTITTVFPERTQDTASTRTLLQELSAAAAQASGRRPAPASQSDEASAETNEADP